MDLDLDYKYNYHCKNDGCSNFVKMVIIEKPQSCADEYEECEHCNGELTRIGIANAYHLGKFNMLSPNERQKVLQKRSRDHYKKHRDEWHQKNKRDIG